MKSVLKTLKVLFLLPMMYACETAPTPPADHSMENSGMPIVRVTAEYFGNYYGEGTSNWEVRIYDQETADSQGQTGNLCVLNIIAPSSSTFLNGLPTGTFTASDEYVSGSIVESGYFSMEATDLAIYLERGTLEIAKYGDSYCLKAKLIHEDGKEIIFEYHAKVNEQIFMADRTYISSLQEDVNPVLNTCKAQYFGNQQSQSTGTWTLFFTGDDLELSEMGSLLPTSTGSAISVLMYDDGSKMTPEGRYEITNTRAPYTAYIGSFTAEKTEGTAYSDFKDGRQVNLAPVTSGYINIEKNSDNTYSVSLEFVDDNPYQSHKITSSYNGKIDIISHVGTGKFTSCGMFFMHDATTEIKSWQIELFSKELLNSSAQNGEKMIFNIYTTAYDSFYGRDLAATYRIAEGEAERNIFNAEIITYTDGKASSTKLTDGSITINYDPASKEYVINYNLTDANENAHIEQYAGKTVPLSYVPSDEVFNMNGAELSVEYYGAYQNFNDWYFLFKNAQMVENPDEGFGRMKVSLEVLTDSKWDFNSGLCEGTYQFVEKNEQIGVSDCLGSTFYGTTSPDGTMFVNNIQSGELSIVRNEGSNYTIEFNFMNEICRKMTGTYTGVVNPMDWSNTAMQTKRVQSYMTQPAPKKVVSEPMSLENMLGCKFDIKRNATKKN